LRARFQVTRLITPNERPSVPVLSAMSPFIDEIS
jgi:hypothetical protein